MMEGFVGVGRTPGLRLKLRLVVPDRMVPAGFLSGVRKGRKEGTSRKEAMTVDKVDDS